MARTLPLGLAPEWDRDFTVGVGVSVVLHVALGALVVFLATLAPARLPPLQSYTVELTDPSALGGRLAFGPLDRPIGRPARVAPASGGAPEGTPRTGEPAALVPPKPTKTAEPVKIAEAPPPTSPPPTAPPTTVPPPTVPPATLPPSTVPPSTAPPSTVPPPPTIPPRAVAPPMPVEPPRELERPKPVETAKPKPLETPAVKSPDADVALRAETKLPEPKPMPQEVPVTRPPPPKPEPEKAKTVPKPPPPPEPAKAETKTETKAETKAVPRELPKPEVKPGAIKPERSAPAPTALAMKSADVKAPHTTPGAAPTPVPTAPATGNGGVGSGGSAEEKVDEKFAAAAERWRSRMAGTSGGLDGTEGQQGPIGDSGEQGGGGAVVDTEYVIYSQRVSSTIKRNWVETDRKSGLVARVRFEISPDGEVSNIRLERSSGDKAYDLSVLRAVQRSSPLPPPPERHRDDFHEMEIDFHPEEGGSASQ
jgi:TonB family protein